MCALLIGFAAHRASPCNVRAVSDIITAGSAHMLWSLLQAVLWMVTLTGVLVFGLGLVPQAAVSGAPRCGGSGGWCDAKHRARCKKWRVAATDACKRSLEATMNRPISSALAIALLAPTFSWAACDLKSGPKTAALVELYTSEGCSSCPPADKRLSQFPSVRYTYEQVVPISLHVDYWDYIGWKEPFAQAQFSERQSWLARTNGHKTVYTPHFFVSGVEVRDWDADLVRELNRVSAETARASIHIHAEPSASGKLSVSASATAPSSAEQLALFVALTEDRIVSRVSAGENSGVTLSHDHVVREWIGPIALSGGHAEVERALTPRSNWNRSELGVVGFVQEMQTGRVLQAVGASECLRS
jgi:hypothetical protein